MTKSITSSRWSKAVAISRWVTIAPPNSSALSSYSPTTMRLGRAPIWVRKRTRSPSSRSLSEARDLSTITSRSVSARRVRGPPSVQSMSITAPASRSSAETRSLPPPSTSFAWAVRRVETSSTPGTWRAASAARGEIGEKPSEFCSTSSPWKLSSTAVAIELLIPAAKTVTKATTARPIISAAAVTAVRAGLRCVFSRARRPMRRRISSSGRPASEASGRTRRGLKSETPSRTATAPAPISPAALPPLAPPKRPARTIASPATPSSTASAATTRPRRRLCGSSSASRAAIGGTRVARRAGTKEETQGDADPDQQRDDDRAVLRHQRGGRQVDPDRDEERVEADGDRVAADAGRATRRGCRSPAPRPRPSRGSVPVQRRACAACRTP